VDSIIKSRFKADHRVEKFFRKKKEDREYDKEDKDKKHDAAHMAVK
jgi:hypothetical protein